MLLVVSTVVLQCKDAPFHNQALCDNEGRYCHDLMIPGTAACGMHIWVSGSEASSWLIHLSTLLDSSHVAMSERLSSCGAMGSLSGSILIGICIRIGVQVMMSFVDCPADHNSPDVEARKGTLCLTQPSEQEPSGKCGCPITAQSIYPLY